jgi:hypothetical protein
MIADDVRISAAQHGKYDSTRHRQSWHQLDPYIFGGLQEVRHPDGDELRGEAV